MDQGNNKNNKQTGGGESEKIDPPTKPLSGAARRKLRKEQTRQQQKAEGPGQTGTKAQKSTPKPGTSTGKEATKSEPWPGAKLSIIDVKDVPKPARALVWIPGPKEEPKTLLKRLETQSPGLHTETWTVVDRKPDQKGQQLVLLMDQPSWVKIEGLQCRPYLDFSRVLFKALGGKEKGHAEEMEVDKGGGESEPQNEMVTGTEGSESEPPVLTGEEPRE